MVLLRSGAATVAALSAAACLAGPADAADVTFWACKGPSGEPLGPAALRLSAEGDGAAGPAGAGCSGTGTADGVRLVLEPAAPAIAGFSAARARVDLPFGVALRRVTLPRSIGGFGQGTDPGSAVRARVLDAAGVLDRVEADGAPGPVGAGPQGATAAGRALTVEVACEEREGCAIPAGGTPEVTFGAVALEATDDTAPDARAYAVRSPVRDGVLALRLDATDAGVGLGTARVLVDGVERRVEDLSGGGCADLRPGGVLDLDLAAPCVTETRSRELDVDVSDMADGRHEVLVLVTDRAGTQTRALASSFETVPEDTTPDSRTATLGLGGGSTAPPDTAAPTGGSTTTGAGGQVIEPRTTCADPQLSVVYVGRIAGTAARSLVLRRGERHAFRGTLTCRFGRIRRVAPVGSPIEVLSRFPDRSLLRRTGTSLRRGGTFRYSLPVRTSRRLIFRVRTTTGAVRTASFDIRVVRRPGTGR